MSKDGGAAFPQQFVKPNSLVQDLPDLNPGMTVRQFYKAAALSALSLSPAANENLVLIGHRTGKIADAMILEDEKFNADQGKTS